MSTATCVHVRMHPHIKYFRYIYYDEPEITGRVPAGGALSAGTMITITGNGFVNNSALRPVFACQFYTSTVSVMVPATLIVSAVMHK